MSAYMIPGDFGPEEEARLNPLIHQLMEAVRIACPSHDDVDHNIAISALGATMVAVLTRIGPAKLPLVEALYKQMGELVWAGVKENFRKAN